MKTTRNATIGTGKGKPRWFTDALWPARVGFTPGDRVSVSYEPDTRRVTIALDEDGERVVSRRVKAGGDTAPVLDIPVGPVFQAGEAVRIVCSEGVLVITPRLVAEHIARRRKNSTFGSLFAGGGLMDEAARRAGLVPRWAVEMSEQFAEVHEVNHPTSDMHVCSVEEVDWTQDVSHVHVLGAGLPCEPYSRARRNNKAIPAEEHHNARWVWWVTRAVEAACPYTVVLECAPGFLDSPAYHLLRGTLEVFGYKVGARKVKGTDQGSIVVRERTIMVATTDDEIVWPEDVAPTTTLADYLDESVPLDAWFPRERLYNGVSVKDPSSTSVPAFSKRYQNRRASDGFAVPHPTVDNMVRYLSVPEMARLMGVDPSYVAGWRRTSVSGPVLGQGVLVPVFERLFRSLTDSLGYFGRVPKDPWEMVDIMVERNLMWAAFEGTTPQITPQLLDQLASLVATQNDRPMTASLMSAGVDTPLVVFAPNRPLAPGALHVADAAAGICTAASIVSHVTRSAEAGTDPTTGPRQFADGDAEVTSAVDFIVDPCTAPEPY